MIAWEKRELDSGVNGDTSLFNLVYKVGGCCKLYLSSTKLFVFVSIQTGCLTITNQIDYVNNY